MKRILAITLSLLLLCTLFAGCRKEPPATVIGEFPEEPKEPEETMEPVEIPEPEEPEEPELPEWEPGIVRPGAIGILWAKLSRGMEVTVTDESVDYYYVTVAGVQVLVEKRFLRDITDPAVDKSYRYAVENAPLFDNPYLEGNPLLMLKKDDKLTVLDELEGEILCVHYGDGTAYLPKSFTNENETPVNPNPTGGGGGGGGSTTGGGGGGSTTGGGTDTPSGGDSGGGGSSEGQDGGDIVLGVYPGAPRLLKLAYDENLLLPVEPFKATVLADNVESYISIVTRGSTVCVTGTADGVCRILTENRMMGTLPEWAVRMAFEEEYAAWSGYSDDEAPAYYDVFLRKLPGALPRNTALRVLDELQGMYLVEAEGRYFYLAPESVGTEPFPEPQPQPSGGYTGGGGGGSTTGGGTDTPSGGGDSGGGDSGGDSGEGEWTEPVLSGRIASRFL